MLLILSELLWRDHVLQRFFIVILSRCVVMLKLRAPSVQLLNLIPDFIRSALLVKHATFLIRFTHEDRLPAKWRPCLCGYYPLCPQSAAIAVLVFVVIVIVTAAMIDIIRILKYHWTINLIENEFDETFA